MNKKCHYCLKIKHISYFILNSDTCIKCPKVKRKIYVKRDYIFSDKRRKEISLKGKGFCVNKTEFKERLQAGTVFECIYHFIENRKDQERIVEKVKTNSVIFENGVQLDLKEMSFNKDGSISFKENNKLLYKFKVKNLSNTRKKMNTTRKNKKQCKRYLVEKYGKRIIDQYEYMRNVQSTSSLFSDFFDEEDLIKYNHEQLRIAFYKAVEKLEKENDK